MEIHTEGAQPYRLSASKIKTWMSCSLQAHFQYDQKLPRIQNSSATFGNCIHNALALYNLSDGDIEKAVADFLSNWADPAAIGLKIDEWTKGTTEKSLRERGEKMLRDYHSLMRWEKRDILATEHAFVVPFGTDFEIHGFVDLVELRLSDQGVVELHIVDYKTNKKQPYMNGLPYDVQFTAYVWAAMQREFWVGTDTYPGIENGEDLWDEFQHVVPKAYWFHLQTAKEIFVGHRTDEDFMRLYRAAKAIKAADENEVYVPNLSGDSCGFCPFKEPCGLPIPKLEDEW